MSLKIILYSLLLSFTIGCNSSKREENTKIVFDNLVFMLPNSVYEIKKSCHLEYQIYRGFRGKSKNYDLLIQLKDYPIWVNDKNVKEDFYYDKRVVGLTFIINSCVDLTKIKKDISQQYALYFSNINNNYMYAEKYNYYIVLYTKKSYCYLSFYNGIKKNEIESYIDGVR